MTVAVTLAGGNKSVTLMCCTDDVILGIGIGIGYWYRWRPSIGYWVLGMLRGIVLTLKIYFPYDFWCAHMFRAVFGQPI